MGMLKRADFWIGFVIAFLLVSFFPQVNILSGMTGSSGSRGQ